MAIIETVLITVGTQNFLAANFLATRLVEGATYMRDADILIPVYQYLKCNQFTHTWPHCMLSGISW